MLYIASDHAGFKLKEYLIDALSEKKINVIDMGPFSYDEHDDYPDTISPLCQKMEAGDKGIIIGGSGQGEAIFANRHPLLRAVVYYAENPDIIRLSREHNDSNVLSLGARFLTPKQALEAVLTWLNTPFTHEERHMRRIAKL